MTQRQEALFWKWFYRVVAVILIVVFKDLWINLFGMYFKMLTAK